MAQADPDQIALQMDDESLGGDEILETIPEEVPGQQALKSKLIAEVWESNFLPPFRDEQSNERSANVIQRIPL